ncbi:MAG: hypothetical protein IAF58_02770 [Leptolyngbya sp.]|nr:hypothetical protein [Candidatus Melainabacteria bacterium]
MNLNFKKKFLSTTSELITNSAVAATVITLLGLAWCFATGLNLATQHFGAAVFQLDRDGSEQIAVFCLLIVYCVFLVHSVSRIENSGVAWSDTSNSDVKDARKRFLFVMFISGVLLVCSKGSLLPVIGLGLMVLVLGLRAGFFFSKFRRSNESLSYIFALTSLLFIVSISWTYFLR